VLGNLRFFITTGSVIIGLMVASALSSMEVSWFTWKWFGIGVVAWVALNFVYDRLLPSDSGTAKGRPFFLKRMHCSNWRFAVFLLIMSGFWTSFNQIFYTMPEYIRDFTDTRPMIRVFEGVFGKSDPNDPNVGVASKMATINKDEARVIVRGVGALDRVLATNGVPSRDLLLILSKDRLKEFLELVPEAVCTAFNAELPEATEAEEGDNERTRRVNRLSDAEAAAVFAVMTPSAKFDTDRPWVDEAFHQTAHNLINSKVRIQPARLEEIIRESDGDIQLASNRVMIECRQVNPEFIVNIDALAIVFLQVMVSFFMARFHRFTTMIVGMLIAAVGIGLAFFAGDNGMLGSGGSVLIVALGLFTFAIGEMMASPTSQEYVGRIAPRDKVALYMGYYFVAVALGNLFGGILSGQLYGKLARDMQRPDLMWLAFGGIMLATAIIFMLYNRFALPKDKADTLMPAT